MNLRHNFYVQPMNQVYIEAAAMYLIWTAAMLLLRGKARKTVAIIGTAGAVGLIIAFTLLGRGVNRGDEHSLIPFISFIYAKTQPEFYRTMFMNMLLFMPLGMSLPFALPEKIKYRALVTIPTGLLLSVCIEAVQFFFGLGKCETDDVLMNTLGVIIGITSFLICKLVDKRKKRKKKY